MKFAKKSTSGSAGQIRLIAGQWRGRKLPVLTREGLRPTTDRNKETLFNWLAPYIAGSRCLDGFAGTGSLGFEALSRHAASVVFVEKDKAAARQIQANCRTLSLATAQAEVWQQDLLKYLNAPAQAFDIVFLDPPFHQDLLAPTLDRLATGDGLSEHALVYIEYESNCVPAIPHQWQCLKQKQAGQVSYGLYQVIPPETPAQ